MTSMELIAMTGKKQMDLDALLLQYQDMKDDALKLAYVELKKATLSVINELQRDAIASLGEHHKALVRLAFELQSRKLIDQPEMTWARECSLLVSDDPIDGLGDEDIEQLAANSSAPALD